MVLVDGLLAIDTHGKHSFQRRAFFDKLYEIIKKSCNGITLTQSTVNKETLTSDNTFPYRNGTNYYPFGIGTIFKNMDYNTFAYHDHSVYFQNRYIYLKSLGFSDRFCKMIKYQKCTKEVFIKKSFTKTAANLKICLTSTTGKLPI